MPYCPNCSCPLEVDEEDCPKCGALFGPNAAWAPTVAPAGPVPARPERRTPKTVLDTSPRLASAKSRGSSKILVVILAVLSLPCVLLAAQFLYDAFWVQWAYKGQWSPLYSGIHHSGAAILILLGTLITHVVLAIVMVCLWVQNAISRAFPHRLLTAWVAVVLASAAAYLPTYQQYAAVAVVLFGPGDKASEFANDAARMDSALLLRALVLRGVKLDERLMCGAANNWEKGARAVGYLVRKGFSTNVDCSYVMYGYLRISRTPLHLAVLNKNHRAAEALVKAGARIDARDHEGKTPLELTEAQAGEEMMRVLKPKSH